MNEHEGPYPRNPQLPPVVPETRDRVRAAFKHYPNIRIEITERLLRQAQLEFMNHDEPIPTKVYTEAWFWTSLVLDHIIHALQDADLILVPREWMNDEDSANSEDTIMMTTINRDNQEIKPHREEKIDDTDEDEPYDILEDYEPEEDQ